MASKESKEKQSSDRYNSLLNPFSKNPSGKGKKPHKKLPDKRPETGKKEKTDKFRELFNPPNDPTDAGKVADQDADQVDTKGDAGGQVRIQWGRSNSSPSLIHTDNSSTEMWYESTDSAVAEQHYEESKNETETNPFATKKEGGKSRTAENDILSQQSSSQVVNDNLQLDNENNQDPEDESKDYPRLTSIPSIEVPVTVHAPAESAAASSPGLASTEDELKSQPAASEGGERGARYRRFGSVSTHVSRPDSPLLSRSFKMTVEKGREVVAVMGAGDYGTALSVRLCHAGYHVLLLTRVAQQTRDRLRDLGCPAEDQILSEADNDPHDAAEPDTSGPAVAEPDTSGPAVADEPAEGMIEVVPREEGLPRASVVFMTVGNRRWYSRLRSLLTKKILIDVSNRDSTRAGGGISNAETLQKLVPSSVVVKSLNTVPAWSLLWPSKPIPKQNPTCSNAAWAVHVVQNILQDAGIPCTRRGHLNNARKLEGLPLTFFPEACVAMIMIAVVLAFFTLINLFRNQLCPLMTQESNSAADVFSDFMLVNTKQVCGQTALLLLTLTYLPGVVAAYVQLSRATKYQAFPVFLDRWMKARKYLGLAAALIVLLHMLTIIISTTFSSASMSKDAWMTPTALGFGAIGVLLLLVQSVFSIPSVGDQMSWAESQFVLSRLGWITYIIATCHVTLIKWPKIFKFASEVECHFIIQGFQLVLLVTVPTIVAKLILLLPWLDNRLTVIRRGKSARRTTRRRLPRAIPEPNVSNV